MIEADMNDMLTIIIVTMTIKTTTLIVWRHLLQWKRHDDNDNKQYFENNNDGKTLHIDNEIRGWPTTIDD